MRLAILPTAEPSYRPLEHRLWHAARTRRHVVHFLSVSGPRRWLFPRKARASAVVRQARSWSPDVVFGFWPFLLSGPELDVLKAARRGPLAAWQLAPEPRPEAGRAVDRWLAGAASLVEEYRAAGAAAEYFPPGYDPGLFHKRFCSRREVRRYAADVVYTGPLTEESLQPLQGLADQDIRIWGPTHYQVRTPGKKIRTFRLNPEDLFTQKFSGTPPSPAQCDIIYNTTLLAASLHPLPDPRSLLRDFEILGCGPLLLTDRPEWLAPAFQEGEEFASFRTADELKEKTLFYLQNPKERAYIAHNGYRRAVQVYTWEKRMAALVEALENIAAEKKGPGLG